MSERNDQIKEQESMDTVVENKTWAPSFVLDGTRYATSLFWQPLRNSDDPYTEIEEASANVLEGADLFSIKKGKSPQFGLCISSQGYKKGTRVAAVSLINALPYVTSFLAVFKVDRGWWYVCVRNDVILSDGDMLFLNEEDAKAQFSSMLVVPDWGYKIAPAEWNISDTKEENLSALLQNSQKEVLQKIHALRGGKLIAVVLAVGLLAAWLLSTLFSLMSNSSSVKPIVAPIAIKKVELKTPPPEPKPWESIEEPSEIFDYCFKGVKDLINVPTPGWTIGGITCTSKAIVTSWRRQVGRLMWVDKALENADVSFASKSISPNGNEVMASLAMPKVTVKNSPPTYRLNDLINTLNDLSQGLQMPIGVSPQTMKTKQQKVYKFVKISFSSKHDPTVWRDILTKFSGFTINVIKYDVHANSWYYEGAIYAL